ncbi:MAG: penicillin-binding protein [Bacteroidota bacterium]|nr:penicillin-binding protein [Bacteroidota bacterium]
MEVKRDILWRVYLCFIGMVIISICVLGKAFYIQHVQGAYWRGLSDSLHQKFVELDAERGTIYSEDSSMLSTSIPYFSIYIDFGADGLREKEGKRFKENLDSLSLCLAGLFKDKGPSAYKRELSLGYRHEDRYFLLQSNISFDQYKRLRDFPLVRQGRNKSGFIAEVTNKRLNPFGLLANRTIGLARSNAQNVGLERTYDTLLKGESGKRLVRYIAGGTYIPVEGYEIEAQSGKDIVTTLDVNIQDIAENALLKGLTDNEATQGTCIVMEVSTGKIKAVANLGRQPDGAYWEDLNYAIRATEPGSTFKLATLMSLLEDKAVALTDKVNIEGGVWKVSGRTVYDSERTDEQNVTVKQAFEHSSNVGMAKLAWAHYGRNPGSFIDHLKQWRFNRLTGIDLAGETAPVIKHPGSRTWSATTLPWMAFGYEVLVSPLQTLQLYNAVANDGKMMQPYLVHSIEESGITVKENKPATVIDKICSDETLGKVKECLEGVCLEGTAKDVFRNSFYKVAGKTGTALVADRNRGYADHIYQSSFAGYFPADHPKYSCIVVIRNKPFARKFYGAAVAAPVFKELADKLMSANPVPVMPALQRDSTPFYYAGPRGEIQQVMKAFDMSYRDSAGNNEWAMLYSGRTGQIEPVLNSESLPRMEMPDVRGMGLKDALYLLESRNIRVVPSGRGKVSGQSIAAGTALQKNETVTIRLN